MMKITKNNLDITFLFFLFMLLLVILYNEVIIVWEDRRKVKKAIV